MPLHDLTADMLTRIRNAVSIHAKQVMVLDNKLNCGVAKVLQEEGFIRGFERIPDNRGGLIRVDLKYSPTGESAIECNRSRLQNRSSRVFRNGRVAKATTRFGHRHCQHKFWRDERSSLSRKQSWWRSGRCCLLKNLLLKNSSYRIKESS